MGRGIHINRLKGIVSLVIDRRSYTDWLQCGLDIREVLLPTFSLKNMRYDERGEIKNLDLGHGPIHLHLVQAAPRLHQHLVVTDLLARYVGPLRL